jgi:hypothetical protein
MPHEIQNPMVRPVQPPFGQNAIRFLDEKPKREVEQFQITIVAAALSAGCHQFCSMRSLCFLRN